ncbi:hypothetical protein LPJ57_001548 [Coemansia sp. RSA 486]|nr:hypothetical protein LPJ57_001548 [Coemansia sp. RSA 486]
MKFTTTIRLSIALVFCKLGKASLTDCSKNLAFQLTNLFQLGQIQYDYGNCEVDDSGNGYAAGIVNFCTGTGDAWQVIQLYHEATGNDDEFTQYDDILQKYAEEGDGSTEGIENFCEIWQQASKTQAFMDAQNQIVDELYFNPSQKYADTLNLTLSISRAQLYDTAISHGATESSYSLGGMVKLANSRFGRDIAGNTTALTIGEYKVDEVEWLKEFLNVRAGYSSEGDATNSIYSYTYILEQGEYMWTDKITVLNNRDNQTEISCANSFMPSVPGSSGTSKAKAKSSETEEGSRSSSSRRSRGTSSQMTRDEEEEDADE